MTPKSIESSKTIDPGQFVPDSMDQLDFRRIFQLSSTQLNSGQLWSTRSTSPLLTIDV